LRFIQTYFGYPVIRRALALGIVSLFLVVLAGCSLGPIDFGGTSGSNVTPGPVATKSPVPTATPAQRSLSGKVLDAYSGLPIASAEVTAGGILTETTNDGTFSFDALPLSVKVSVSADGYAQGEVDPGKSGNVSINLRPSTLSGRVTDASTGKALAGVLVKLVTSAEDVTATTSLTTGGTVTPTTVSTTVPLTGGLLYGKGLAAPLAEDTSTPEASTEETSPAAATPTDAPTSTPLPPTATRTPKPIPPTGPGFVAVYTDDEGAFFFKDVSQGANLTFKIPGYKVTKMPVGETTRKDVALEVFKPHAIYITAPVAATKDMYDGLMSFIDNSKINAVVLNVQNDNSEWVFETKNPDAVAAKNTDVFLPEMPQLVKALKDKGIYTIARVVTFQQPTMAKARLDMAVKSSVTGKAWIGGELNQQAWLDASIPKVQDYMVDMTKEVLTLGFDEIQYDYVRFPSDPAPKEPGKPTFSRPLTDTTKAEAIGQFLEKAHDVIEPTDSFMSIDIFGYTLWPDKEGKPMNGVIGQVFEYVVDHTDYVCPMIYPSHFSVGEQDCSHPEACAYKLVHKSGEFAAKRFEGKKAKYRPWLQDFDWGKTDYTSKGTTKVTEQIQAAGETGAWGWQFWDPYNDYQPRAAFK